MDGLIHSALLTTLVYRFGAPGSATRNPHKVQANGQCFLSRREILVKTEAFRAAQSSLCEDITIARRLADCGEAVGFYESDGLVEASMYRDWRETWRNWPRSLPMRDQYFGPREAAGLLAVLLVQALPLPLFIFGWIWGAPSWFFGVTAPFVLIRLGVLAGVARAYPNRPWTYWLSPLWDLPVAFRLIQSALARRHSWRGRSYIRGKAVSSNRLATDCNNIITNGFNGRQPSINQFTDNAIAGTMRFIAKGIAAGRLQTSASGLEHIPPQGPALVVARHYHHLFDGLALFTVFPWPFHIVVTLDWVQSIPSKLLCNS